MMSVLYISAVFCSSGSNAHEFTIGERETIVTKEQRESLGLSWFMDGNLGVLADGGKTVMYGANGSKPVRVTGTFQEPLQKAENVSISSGNSNFKYLSGGPIYLDPGSNRIFLFYHAEIHRGTEKNFYSVLGLAVQTDKNGLQFQDLGSIFTANIPSEKAKYAIELCGSPYVINGDYFYVYARDALMDGSQINLAVSRARIADVINAGLEGKSVEWKKFWKEDFTEPALGGRSAPIEEGNPGTRWMDVSYNTVIGEFIMVVAANTGIGRVELFLSTSKDGLHWGKRNKLADEDGESFYPSFIAQDGILRQTGNEFYVWYTYSKKGGWDRWSDAVIVRRKITVRTSGTK